MLVHDMNTKILCVAIVLCISFVGVYEIAHTTKSMTIETNTSNIEVIEYSTGVQEMIDSEAEHRVTLSEVLNYTNQYKEHNIYVLTNHNLYVFYFCDDEIYYYENKDIFVIGVEISNNTIVFKYRCRL